MASWRWKRGGGEFRCLSFGLSSIELIDSGRAVHENGGILEVRSNGVAKGVDGQG